MMWLWYDNGVLFMFQSHRVLSFHGVFSVCCHSSQFLLLPQQILPCAACDHSLTHPADISDKIIRKPLVGWWFSHQLEKLFRLSGLFAVVSYWIWHFANWMFYCQVPGHPGLTGNVDPTKIDEIKRTVYVGNLSSTVWHVSRLCMFSNVSLWLDLTGSSRRVLWGLWGGEVCAHVWRWDTANEVRLLPALWFQVVMSCLDCRYAFVEFDNVDAVEQAMQLTGVVFGDRPIK